jgi:sugar (pentulose or hexulose) kinase
MSAGAAGGLLLGVDIGTTRVKALALTPDGTEVGAAERVTPWNHAGRHTDVDPSCSPTRSPRPASR